MAKTSMANTDAVIILAAGEGTRMGRYNLVPKHLLPAKAYGPAILSHIMLEYPGRSNFIVVIDKNDRYTANYIKAAHPHLEVQIVLSEGRHRGFPLHDLALGLSHIGRSRSVFITVADGLYDIPVFTDEKNWLGVKKLYVKDQLNYTNLTQHNGLLTQAVEKVPGGVRSYSWSGVGYFGSVNSLKNALAETLRLSSSATFADLFNKAINFMDIHVLGHEVWTDLGSEELYSKVVPAFDWSKPDQITYNVLNRVVKFWQDPSQAEYFHRKQQIGFTLPLRFPFTFHHGNFVSYNHVLGSSAYEVMTAKMLTTFLSVLHHNFWGKERGGDPTQKTQEWAVQKARDRLGEVDDLIENAFPDYINGVEITDSWSETLESIAEAKMDQKFGLIHGDLTLDNLVVTPDNNIIMVDWRPETMRGRGHNPLGDVYYDLGKLWLSMQIDFKELKAGKFELISWSGSMEIAMPTNSRLKYLQHVFMTWCIEHGFDMHTIKTQAVLQLASMAGVHKAPYSEIFYWYALYLAHKTA